MAKTEPNELRAAQLREAKRRQRDRQRKAGVVHVQLTLPRAIAEKIAVARRSGDFEHVLGQVLDRCLIQLEDYPQLNDLAWNRSEPFIPAREAFQLCERNWRFVDEARLSATRAGADRSPGAGVWWRSRQCLNSVVLIIKRLPSC